MEERGRWDWQWKTLACPALPKTVSAPPPGSPEVGWLCRVVLNWGEGARASSSCMATEGGLPPRAGCDLVLVALFTASPGEGLSGNSAPPQEGRARAAGLEVVTGAGSAPSAAQASYCSHPLASYIMCCGQFVQDTEGPLCLEKTSKTKFRSMNYNFRCGGPRGVTGTHHSSPSPPVLEPLYSSIS